MGVGSLHGVVAVLAAPLALHGPRGSRSVGAFVTPHAALHGRAPKLQLQSQLLSQREWYDESRKEYYNEVQWAQRELAHNIHSLGRGHVDINSAKTKWEAVEDLMKDARAKGLPLNKIHYNCAISVAGRLSLWEKSLGLREEMIAAGIEPNHITSNSIINALARGGEWEAALKEFAAMKRPDSVSYSSAIDACCRGKKPDEALALLRQSQSAGLQSEWTFSSAMTALGDAGRWQEALALLDEMSSSDGNAPPPTTPCFNAAINALASAGQWQGALSTLTRMKEEDVMPNAQSYCTVIAACGRGGRFGDAQALLREMRECGMKPAVYAYSAAIQAAKKSDQVISLLQEMLREDVAPNLVTFNLALDRVTWQHGLVLFDEMAAFGIVPNEKSYNSLARSLAMGKQDRKAVLLIKTMRSQNMHASRSTLRACIGSCASAGSFKMATKLLRDLTMLAYDGGAKLQPPSKSLFDTVLRAAAEKGDWKAAKKLLDTMQEIGVPPDDTSCSIALRACTNDGRWSRALSLFKTYVDSGYAGPKSASAAVSAAAQSQQWKRGANIVKWAKQEGLQLRFWVHSTAIQVCARAGMVQLARECLSEAWAAGGSTPQASDYAELLSSVIDEHHSNRESAERIVSVASDLLKEAVDKGVQPAVVFFGAALTGFSRIKDWRTATALIEYMRQYDIPLNTRCYSSVISACGQAGEWARGILFLETMSAEGIEPDEICYNCAITGVAHAGRWEEALLLMEVMEKRGLAPGIVTLNAAISACARGRQFERAKVLLQRMLDVGPTPDVVTYTSIINAAGRAGNWQQARDYLVQMQDAGIKPNWITYNALMGAMRMSGEWKAQLDLFQVSPFPFFPRRQAD
jgi:pentatricopeptide repeat protein